MFDEFIKISNFMEYDKYILLYSILLKPSFLYVQHVPHHILSDSILLSHSLMKWVLLVSSVTCYIKYLTFHSILFPYNSID